jgi:electron transfer flavoprotein beta subunit
MDILVLLKMVPDVVEELEIAGDGRSIDLDVARMIPSESDDHALEQALILKEIAGGKVTVLAPEAAEVDDALFTALAKGADRVVKVTGLEPGLTTRQLAHELAGVIANTPGLLPVDLILTGTQAIDDADSLLAPMVAHELKLPYLPIVTKVRVAGACATVLKEYAGGVHGEFEVPLPAVLGMQAAEKPPRYVPVAKVRAAMKTQRIEGTGVATMANGGGPLIEVVELAKPEASGHAEMLEGSPEEVAGKLCGILAERGLI